MTVQRCCAQRAHAPGSGSPSNDESTVSLRNDRKRSSGAASSLLSAGGQLRAAGGAGGGRGERRHRCGRWRAQRDAAVAAARSAGRLAAAPPPAPGGLYEPLSPLGPSSRRLAGPWRRAGPWRAHSLARRVLQQRLQRDAVQPPRGGALARHGALRALDGQEKAQRSLLARHLSCGVLELALVTMREMI